MRQETARHPVTLHNLWPYLSYWFVSAPLILLLPFALGEWRRRKLSPLLLLAIMGLLADLALYLSFTAPR